MIWFINTNAATNGDGRIDTPFNTLANFVAGAADDAGDSIFLYESATNYTGPLTLLHNQRLIGQDAALPLATLAGVTAPADTIPLPTMNTAGPSSTIAGAGVTLNSGNQIHGLTLGTAIGTALTGTSFGTLTVSTVTILAIGGTAANGGALSLTTGTLSGSFTGISSTGGTNNILLSGVAASGTVALGTGALSGASAEAFKVVGGSGTFTYGGSITGGAGGAAISVAGGSASVTFSGNVSQAGNAALLSVSGGHTGTLTFTGTVSATGGTGLQFDNADGTYNLDGVASGSRSMAVMPGWTSSTTRVAPSHSGPTSRSPIPRAPPSTSTRALRRCR